MRKSPLTLPGFALRPLGNTGLAIPELGLGTAHFGELFKRLDEGDVRAAFAAAWDGGIRFYDTAPWYGHGLSERRVGSALIDRPRADFIVSTKVGRTYTLPTDDGVFTTAPWVGGLRFQHSYDYSYDGIMRSWHDSLLRLGLNRIDMLVIHDLDKLHHDEPALARHWADLEGGGIRALEELKRASAIAAIGAGINEPSMIAPMASRLPVDFLLVAMPYTLLDQDALDDGLPACAANNVSVVVGAPFASGILATGAKPGARYNYTDASPTVLQRVAEIERVCAAFAVPLPAAALRYPLGHPAVAAVIPGAVSSAEVEANLRHVATAIPPAFWTALRDEGLVRSDAPLPT